MPTKRDYYDVLGVPRNASEDDIRKAFRKLARRTHPDVNPGDKTAEAKFKEIAEAHEVLSDKQKRARYDQFGHAEEAAGAGFPGGFGRAGGPFEFRFEGSPEGFGNFEDLFSGLFGGAFRPRRGGRGFGAAIAEDGEDILAEMEVEFLESLMGATKGLTLESSTGKETLKVKVPPGIRDGQKIRLAGKGHPGSGGGEPGDLYLKVSVRPHGLIARDGDDLRMEVPVTVGEAVNGASVTVPTPWGEVTAKIPPGMNSGKSLRLRGMGAPVPGKEARGDLYLKLCVVLPDAPDEAARAAAKAMESSYRGNVRSGLKL